MMILTNEDHGLTGDEVSLCLKLVCLKFGVVEVEVFFDPIEIQLDRVGL